MWSVVGCIFYLITMVRIGHTADVMDLLNNKMMRYPTYEHILNYQNCTNTTETKDRL